MKRRGAASHIGKALAWLAKAFNKNSRCDLCGKHAYLVVDHSHVTKMIRGLLCHNCNGALSYHWENREWRKKAIAYVDHNPVKLKYSSAISRTHVLKSLGCKFRR